MNVAKKISILMFSVIFFYISCLPSFVYAETEISQQTYNTYQIKLNLNFTNFGHDINSDLFGIDELEVIQIIKIMNHNEDGINELTGYFVTIKIPNNIHTDELIKQLSALNFIEEVKLQNVPGSFDLDLDISNIKKENHFSSVFGDVNLDYRITAADARLVLQNSARINNKQIDFNIADVNNDKKITAADARLILRVSANIEDLDICINAKTQTEYLIGPIGSNWNIGNWSAFSLNDNVSIIEDYTIDISTPGNMGYTYYVISANKPGIYSLKLENEKQQKNISLFITFENN